MIKVDALWRRMGAGLHIATSLHALGMKNVIVLIRINYTIVISR